MYKSSSKNKSKGFTLIEIIISLAIFTVVAVIAVGALLRVMDANRKALSLKTSINNLNFVMESMSREIRVGTKYYFDTDSAVSNTISPTYSPTITSGTTLASGSWRIAFKSSNRDLSNTCNLIYAYRYINNTLQKAQQDENNCNDSITDSDFQNVISSDVKLSSTRAIFYGATAPYPSYAFFWFKAETGVKEKDKVEFSIQTRVSQRINN